MTSLRKNMKISSVIFYTQTITETSKSLEEEYEYQNQELEKSLGELKKRNEQLQDEVKNLKVSIIKLPFKEE